VRLRFGARLAPRLALHHCDSVHDVRIITTGTGSRSRLLGCGRREFDIIFIRILPLRLRFSLFLFWLTIVSLSCFRGARVFFSTLRKLPLFARLSTSGRRNSSNMAAVNLLVSGRFNFSFYGHFGYRLRLTV
jgi:hypothetical protein